MLKCECWTPVRVNDLDALGTGVQRIVLEIKPPCWTLTPTRRPVIISCLITSSNGADITSSEVNDDIVLWD